MNKYSPIGEFFGAISPKPEPELRTMTRKEKLTHWARIVRGYNDHLMLYHGIEFMTHFDLATLRPFRYVRDGYAHSALSLAAADPEFQQQGLKPESTIKDIMNFMEINQEQLHEFGCDCGGHISAETQAYRIEQLI